MHGSHSRSADRAARQLQQPPGLTQLLAKVKPRPHILKVADLASTQALVQASQTLAGNLQHAQSSEPPPWPGCPSRQLLRTALQWPHSTIPLPKGFMDSPGLAVAHHVASHLLEGDCPLVLGASCGQHVLWAAQLLGQQADGSLQDEGDVWQPAGRRRCINMRKTCGTAEISPANPARECPHTRPHPSPDITGQTASHSDRAALQGGLPRGSCSLQGPPLTATAVSELACMFVRGCASLSMPTDIQSDLPQWADLHVCDAGGHSVTVTVPGEPTCVHLPSTNLQNLLAPPGHVSRMCCLRVLPAASAWAPRPRLRPRPCLCSTHMTEEGLLACVLLGSNTVVVSKLGSGGPCLKKLCTACMSQCHTCTCVSGTHE